MRVSPERSRAETSSRLAGRLDAQKRALFTDES
jgi:hypothetical protein